MSGFDLLKRRFADKKANVTVKDQKLALEEGSKVETFKKAQIKGKKKLKPLGKGKGKKLKAKKTNRVKRKVKGNLKPNKSKKRLKKSKHTSQTN